MQGLTVYLQASFFRFLFLFTQTYKAFLPAMIANNHGHLVSIASSAGLIGVNGLAGVCFLLLIISYHACSFYVISASFKFT